MMGGSRQTPGVQGTPVSMQNIAYQPAHIQVRVGTTVTWTNRDSVPHSVTFKNGMKDSGLLSQGQVFSSTFRTPRTYQYFCTIHPSMIATITVVP
jgi:plastocyanin